MSEIDDIIAYLQEQGAAGVLVAQDGQLDVSSLLAAGWTLEEGETVIHGKRIRTLRAPECCCRQGAARAEEGMEFVCLYCPYHSEPTDWSCAKHA